MSVDGEHRGAAWLYVWGSVSGIGGTETRMVEAAQELASRGIQVHSFVHSKNMQSPFIDLFRERGLRMVASNNWVSLFKLWRALRPEVIIAFGIRPSFATRIFSRVIRGSSRIVMARNGLDFGWSHLAHFLDRTTSSAVDVYLANSHSVVEHLRNRGIATSKIALATSGLSSIWYGLQVQRKGQPVVAMVGNHRPEKNHAFGLRTFLTCGIRGELRIYTNNGASLRGLLYTYAADGVPISCVRIVEKHQMTPADYDEVDVLLHPSTSESLPRAILEARARGCRIVASAVGDSPQIVTEDCGTVIYGYSAEEYGRAIKREIGISRSKNEREVVRAPSLSSYVDSMMSQLR